jgi:hypothetical protein
MDGVGAISPAWRSDTTDALRALNQAAAARETAPPPQERGPVWPVAADLDPGTRLLGVPAGQEAPLKPIIDGIAEISLARPIPLADMTPQSRMARALALTDMILSPIAGASDWGGGGGGGQ